MSGDVVEGGLVGAEVLGQNLLGDVREEVSELRGTSVR